MDEALFDSACESGVAVLRLYTWPEPAVTIGFTQWRTPEAWPAPEQVPIVRRITGGRGILHGDDVTVSLSLPADLLANRNVPLGPIAIYRWLTPAFAGAFRQFDVCATTGSHTARAAGAKADCFAAAAAGDLVDGRTGAKLLGAAVRIHRGGALVQASIPYRSEPDERTALRSLVLGGRRRPVQSFDWNRQEFDHALQHSVSSLIEEPCVPRSMSRREAQRTDQLAAIYASPKWNHLGRREADAG